MKCKHCKKDFERSNSDVKRGRIKFCTRDCYLKEIKIVSEKRVEAILRNNRKQCQFCKKTKSLDNFFKKNNSRDGFGSYCKDCKLKKNTISWKANKHKHIEQRKNSHLEKKYGITLKEYKKILSNQNGVCLICRNKDIRKLAVDHNHKTGEIRGLLCGKCNQGIGLFNDDIKILRRAIEYLKNGWY